MFLIMFKLVEMPSKARGNGNFNSSSFSQWNSDIGNCVTDSPKTRVFASHSIYMLLQAWKAIAIVENLRNRAINHACFCVHFRGKYKECLCWENISIVVININSVFFVTSVVLALSLFLSSSLLPWSIFNSTNSTINPQQKHWFKFQNAYLKFPSGFASQKSLLLTQLQLHYAS